MCILINRIYQNVTLDGRPHLLTSALLSRGGIPPQPTFPNLLSHNLLMKFWFLHLHYCLSVLRLLSILRQGPRINKYFWALYPYNSPSKFPSFAPRKRKGFWYFNPNSALPSHHSCLCRCLFNCLEARSWCFDIRNATVINSRGSMFPTFYGTMGIELLGILWECEREFSCSLFSLIYILLKHFIHLTFHIQNSRASPRSISSLSLVVPSHFFLLSSLRSFPSFFLSNDCSLLSPLNFVLSTYSLPYPSQMACLLSRLPQGYREL